MPRLLTFIVVCSHISQGPPKKVLQNLSFTLFEPPQFHAFEEHYQPRTTNQYHIEYWAKLNGHYN